ncbi:hypothetical protein H4I95_11463 [Botrytis cinerea]
MGDEERGCGVGCWEWGFGGVWWGFVCWNSETWDIRWIYLIPGFDLVGGGKVVMVSLLYTYIGEETDAESKKGGLSSALYRLVALQLFSSFTALSLAGFLLKYEYGVWVICALAVGCRALSVGISMLLPSGRAVELNTDRQSVEVDTSMERRRYRDFMHEDQQDNDSGISSSSINHDTSSVLSTNLMYTNIFPQQAKPKFSISPQASFLSLVFLLTFSLKISILYPQFTSLSQNLPYNVTTTIYSLCLLGSSILLMYLPRIVKFMNRRRKLRVLFIRREEGEEAEIEEREGIECEGENDFLILKWCLLVNIMSLILLALPTTRGAVFWVAIGGSVVGSPVQVALLAWGSGLVADSDSGGEHDFEDESHLREAGFISTARSVLQDLESEVGGINCKGKESGRSEMEKFYVRMGILEQVGACLGTGVWSLGFARGMSRNEGFVNFARWNLKGWMDEKGGFVLAAGLLGLCLLVAVRLERRIGGENREGRILLW